MLSFKFALSANFKFRTYMDNDDIPSPSQDFSSKISMPVRYLKISTLRKIKEIFIW